MALSKEIKKYLDSLPDDLFLAELSLRFGEYIPKWKEISKEEYDKHCGKIGLPDEPLTIEGLEQAMNTIGKYKVEPIYKDAQCGILFWINEAPNRKPDGYKYYENVGSEFVIMLGSDMMDYCNTRKCMKSYFKRKEKNNE